MTMAAIGGLTLPKTTSKSLSISGAQITMSTFLACSTSGDGRCLDGRLRVVRVDGAAERGSRSLEDIIRLHVEEALEARDARRAAKAGGSLTFLLEKTPAAGRGPVPQSDLSGDGKFGNAKTGS